jgi:pyruvate formate lyase activating enzyme
VSEVVPAPRVADLWEPWRGGPAVHCRLCAHHCRIEPAERGLCGVRENRDGTLHTLVYGCPIAAAVDPIEKKPLFHFLPGSSTYSVATVGCNFTCAFCQNADISQMPREHGRIQGTPLAPADVVAQAMASGCRSVSYTYTEPTIFYEYARDCAVGAAAAGLANVFVTNGYMTADALAGLAGILHAANVDLKSFSDEFYRTIVGARLRPVLETIRRMVAAGVWVEVTTLLIPGRNDSDSELEGLAGFLASVDRDLPWHVSRFHPAYRLTDVDRTPTDTIDRALAIGAAAGLRYVYAGNAPGHDTESTRCPVCGETVIERAGFSIGRSRLNGAACGTCGAVLPLIVDLPLAKED